MGKKLIKRSWRRVKKAFNRQGNSETPLIIDKRHHNISIDDISPNALKVLHRLRSLDHDAYLVGGSLRDLLWSRRARDFDVVTDAPPEAVRQIFRNSRLIGRRFRLVHVYFRNEIIEVSTFRANAEESLKDQHLGETKGKRPAMLLQDNAYGTIEEDAWRRDFTINALYFNIADSTVVDYTGGIKDLRRGVIHVIGDPTQRFHEDPVRLLRVIRMMAKLKFTVDSNTQEPLQRLHSLLCHVPSARLFVEVLKLFFEGYAYATYELLTTMGYMQALFPSVMDLAQPQQKKYKRFIELAMGATDERFRQEKSLNPGFLLGVLLWPMVQKLLAEHLKKNKRLFPALYYGINMTLEKQCETLLIPRRLTAMMRAVWTLQYHLERRRSKRIYRIFYQRYFRAAFDFLALRAKAGEPLQELVAWWQDFQESNTAEKQRMVERLQHG